MQRNWLYGFRPLKLLGMDEGALVAMKKCLRLPKSQDKLIA